MDLHRDQTPGEKQEKDLLLVQAANKPVADRPGSQEEESWTIHNTDGCMIGETINITSMRTNGHTTMERKTHFTAFQEHGMEPHETIIFKGALGERVINMLAGPRDPEHAKKSGGVGMMAQSPLRPIGMQPTTEDFKDAIKTGRMAAYHLDIANATITVVLIYGGSGGHQNEVAATRTNDLFLIARQELSMQPIGLHMIMGHINGEVEDFPCLQEMLHEEAWTDTAAKASIWGGTDRQATCHASSKAKQTKRDYIFVTGTSCRP